jgi:hypothetical protein
MDCIQKLIELTKECEPCIVNAKIIEFETLPEQEKPNYRKYDKAKDYLIYCEKCKVYKLLQSD